MKNVSIKKRARKNNNNNKKYNKTQTKRSRRNKTQRNKTQRINRRRRNFRNKTHRGGVSHRPSRLSQVRNAYGVPIGSAARIAQGYGAAKSIAPTNSKAEIAAALLRQQSYDPREIDVEEVQQEISREIQLMIREIDDKDSKIKELEEQNTKLQGEINGKQYLEASAEERSIMSVSIGDQVRQNYSEIARKKREIDNLKSSIKGNKDAMKKLVRNIATIINTSKIRKEEYGENTPRGQLIKKIEENDPDGIGTLRRTITSRIPISFSRFLFPTPGSITS
jgi:hypothetical protein